MPDLDMVQTGHRGLHRWLTPVASVLGAFCYITLALLAYVRYPLHYSPLTNWLSDLGNRNISPSGALFYNAGIVLTGLWLALFFLGLSAWRLERNRLQNVMLVVAQCCGIAGAAAMIMTAVFPIDLPAAHSAWSAPQRIATGTGFAFSVAALRYSRACPRWILGVGAVTALADMVVSIFFNSTHVLEWVVIGLFLGYVLLIGIATRRLLVVQNA